MKKWQILNLLAGLFISLVFFFRLSNPVESLLLFSGWVMQPMILYISETFDRNRNLSRFYQILLWMQPIFAGFLSISLLAPANAFPYRIFFAVLWFLYTLLTGVFGLSRLIRRGFRPLAETAIDTALLYLPLGGFWFVMYQFDQPFMSFAVPILLLTAIHPRPFSPSTKWCGSMASSTPLSFLSAAPSVG